MCGPINENADASESNSNPIESKKLAENGWYRQASKGQKEIKMFLQNGS